MKKTMALLLSLLMVLLPSGGLAEAVVLGGVSSGALIADGVAYRVTDGILWSREEDADWKALGEIEAQFAAMRLVAGDERLFAMNLQSGEMAELSRETGETVEKFSLDWEDMELATEEYETVRPVSRAFVSGDRLYVLTYEDDLTARMLLRFDLESGDCEQVDAEDVFDIAPDGSGNAVAILFGYAFAGWEGAPALVALDLESGETEEICELPEDTPFGLAWDAENATAYFFQNGRLMAAGEETQTRVAGYMPFEAYGDSMEGWAEGDRYACGYGAEAYFLSTDPEALPERVLTVAGLYDNAVTAAFREAHPQIPVVNSNLDVERLMEGLLSGTASADVYGMTLDSSEMQAILARNYAQPLGGEGVTRAVEGMYPQFAEALKGADGQIMAFPYVLSAYCLGYSPEVWEAVGLKEEDLPQTWEELFLFMARWQEEFAQEYPEYAIFEEEQLSYLRDALLSKLMDDFLAGGEQLDQEALCQALEAFAKVDFGEFGEKAEGMGGYAISLSLFGEGEKPGSLFTINKSALLESYDIAPGYEILPLKTASGAEGVILMSMEALFVNPHSPNKELAMEMLDLWAENMSGILRANLMPGEEGPVENPYYDQMMEGVREQEELARQSLESASEDDRESYERALLEAEEAIAWMEAEYRYYATEEEVALYRQRAGSVLPKGAKGLSGDDDETAQLVQRFCDGQMDARAFSRTLAQRLQMMRLENS